MAAEFEYTDEQVRKGVEHFMHQMSMLRPHWHGFFEYERHKANKHLAEGLEKNGSTMAQIPTYVTAAPNGTEKVGFPQAKAMKCRSNM